MPSCSRSSVAKDADNNLELGNALLTKTGAGLAPICGSRPVDGFWEYVQDKWKQASTEEGGRTRRCTEWRPRDAGWQFGSHVGAAIGELNR